jgi:TnpA family transposase
VTPGTLHDSPYVLDGLLEHQTELQPRQLMTDSAGYSDIVFGLFWLLGVSVQSSLNRTRRDPILANLNRRYRRERAVLPTFKLLWRNDL